MISKHNGKNLCDLISDHAWKEKEYLREEAKLDKMIQTWQFFRIKCAFTATSKSSEGLDNRTTESN